MSNSLQICVAPILTASLPAFLNDDLDPSLRLPPVFVVGEITAWGNMSFHELGWRAEFAMVHSLWTSGLTLAETQNLGDAYDAPANRLVGLRRTSNNQNEEQ